jgi:hypothetical protein
VKNQQVMNQEKRTMKIIKAGALFSMGALLLGFFRRRNSS